ncbi:MAG TPA: hypothetical protein VN281_04000 [Verrucomicrobiae bacterium]|nr:hypothetical protein [Verrucomicrobiae bacterium]
MAVRFTLDGSDELEEHLGETCRRVADAVKSVAPARALEAIVQGGGYGRGEGGVWRSGHGDAPYNDLEFYVFVRGNPWLNDRRYSIALGALGERLSESAGVHVEFKIHSRARLRRSPVSMFSYDLVAGHRMVFGDERLFDGCEHHLHAGQIPLHEATRLLFNRCSGLLLVKDLLRGESLTPEQADFAGRNLAKAELSFGDVVLALLGFYHWSCLVRNERLRRLNVPEELPWLADVQARHTGAVEFKLHPQKISVSKTKFEERHAQVTDLAEQIWIWLERWRLSRSLGSPREYAMGGWSKCPETVSWRNLLVNLKTFGPRAIVSAGALRYPRERLLNALSLMLWDKQALTEDAARKCLKRNLLVSNDDWPELLRAYRRIWPVFG